MPEMYEIYDKHADKYEELIQAEDYQHNLPQALHNIIDWNDLAVIEGGVGTGRVTRQYVGQVASSICCDRSQHMLDSAHNILAEHSNKLTFIQAANTDIPKIDQPCDVFIEGWSFGHCASDCNSPEEIQNITPLLLHNATKNLKPGSTIILIETLGTNTESPGAPNDKLKIFYHELENQHGFTLKQIRTDYQFESNDEAARIMGFFFGEKMQQAVHQERGSRIIPEWTGIWTKNMPIL